MIAKLQHPQNVHIIIPRTCEYGPLPDRGDFADMIKAKDLRWGNYLEQLSRLVQCNHMSPKHREHATNCICVAPKCLH